MKKKKSPKIYKVKTGSMKSSTTRNILSAVVMVAAAGLVGFVGYSVAKPFIKDDAAQNESDLQLNNVATTTTALTTEAVTTDLSAVVTDLTVLETEETEAGEETTTVATTTETTVVVTTTQEASEAVAVVTTTEAQSEETETAETTEAESANTTTNSVSLDDAVTLSASDLKDEASFRAALSEVQGSSADQKAVIVPMKSEGGTLNYASTVSYVAGTEVCVGSMTASQIVSIAKEEGFAVYASISALDDCQFPELYRDAGIQLEDGSGRWLDNSKEKGGKPWMSPYSSTTVSYLTAIIQELEKAGFSAAICQDFTYPSFRESDRNFISETDYFSDTRDEALQDLADAMQAAASSMTVVIEK
jgi:tRNA(Leu) C34 or U34 (ribose-2'-O)-methylase TrmL